LRTLRRELGINQTQMAGELEVSPSYLNHLERNQRPLTAQMLLRLANTYDIDVRDFVSGPETTSTGELSGVFADGLVADLGIHRHEIDELIEAHPTIAEAIGRLHRALGELRSLPDALRAASDGTATAGSPLEWLRDFLQQRRNHLPELDAVAEELAAALPDDPAERQAAIRARLKEKWGIKTLIAPPGLLGNATRHYDFHRRRLMIAEALDASGRQFALAYQLSLLAFEQPLAAQVERAGAPDAATRTLLKIALIDYTAAALLMPYDRLRAAAEESRYDLPLLMARFGVSFEQLAHRLTTLGRTTARGIPFFLVKIDAAGQVAKRHLGEAYPFARHGGVCPRWRALGAGDGMLAEVVENPAGERFVTVSRRVNGGIVAIGCEAKHAPQIVHCDGLTGPTTIGPSCPLCDRTDCPDRALPAIGRTVELNQFRRPTTPWSFRRA
jgi:predicted transcriptional regulator/plasmid maintenance system antidote protein VapI